MVCEVYFPPTYTIITPIVNIKLQDRKWVKYLGKVFYNALGIPYGNEYQVISTK